MPPTLYITLSVKVSGTRQKTIILATSDSVITTAVSWSIDVAVPFTHFPQMNNISFPICTRQHHKEEGLKHNNAGKTTILEQRYAKPTAIFPSISSL